MTSDRRGFRNAIVPSFRRRLVASAIAALALAPVPTLAAIDMFLRLQGIEGESTDKRHPKEIVVLSYSFGVGTLPEGPIANRPCESLDVVKNLDKASPKLMQVARTGTHIPTGVLAFTRTAEGPPEDFYRIEMTSIAVSMVAQSGATGGAMPVEAVTLRARTYKVSYKTLGRDGQLDRVAVEFGWDCSTNRPPL